ncbi:MAG: type II toxin-antitoxin system PemK/MazF family toxin [Spirochaetaceae bacterium]|nr:MAG: type II toxin-antitoxin system PemK/MazF family toxin [Spirochaetaceae bacterium]
MTRGEVWSINLDPTVGSEIRKTRPAAILSIDATGALPLRVIVPFTGWKTHFSQAPWLVHVISDRENGLAKDSAADTVQVRSISELRFVERLGVLSASDLGRIEDAIRLVLGL